MSLNAPEHFKTPARPTIARREVLVPQKRTLNGTRGNETESTLMLSHNDHHIRNIPDDHINNNNNNNACRSLILSPIHQQICNSPLSSSKTHSSPTLKAEVENENDMFGCVPTSLRISKPRLKKNDKKRKYQFDQTKDGVCIPKRLSKKSRKSDEIVFRRCF